MNLSSTLKSIQEIMRKDDGIGGDDNIEVDIIIEQGKQLAGIEIKTEADYRAALKKIESLMLAKAESAEGEKLDVLVTLVEAYESKHYPLTLPDPVEAIKFEMEGSLKIWPS